MSQKLDDLLSQDPHDWNEIRKAFLRLRSAAHQHGYFCRLIPHCSPAFVDHLLNRLERKGHYGNRSDEKNGGADNETRLPQLIASVWTSILGEDVSSDPANTPQQWTSAMGDRGMANKSRPRSIKPEWKILLTTARDYWNEYRNGHIEGHGRNHRGGGAHEFMIPDRDQVLEALSKTARIVRCQARPMQAPPLGSIRQVRLKWGGVGELLEAPTLPLLHYFVYNHLPPLIVYIAALIAPNQLSQRDAWGNLPLHYANLSAYSASQWWHHINGLADGTGCYLYGGSDLERRSSHVHGSNSLVAIPNLMYHQLLREEHRSFVQHHDLSVPVTPWNHSYKQEREDRSDSSNHDKDEDTQHHPQSAPLLHQQAQHEVDCRSTLFHLLMHETSVPLLLELYPSAAEQSCRLGRLPLHTYLLSLLDYQRGEQRQQLHLERPHRSSTMHLNRHRRSHRRRKQWHFIHIDIELLLKAYPQSTAAVDPLLNCFPILLPFLIRSSRRQRMNETETVQMNDPNLHSNHHTANNRNQHIHFIDSDCPPDTAFQPHWPLTVPDPIFDEVSVNLTFELLRHEPLALHRTVSLQTTRSLMSLYESHLYEHWHMHKRTSRQLLFETKQLEAEIVALENRVEQLKGSSRTSTA
jgi:hypothetical protein